VEASLNIDLINAAKARIQSIPVLVNMVSQRVRQLNNNERPLVKPAVGEEKVDVALREIAEGLLGYEVAVEATPDPMSF
jgi:DNA-directed RNA polymerase omega subunit